MLSRTLTLKDMERGMEMCPSWPPVLHVDENRCVALYPDPNPSPSPNLNPNAKSLSRHKGALP